MDLSYPATRYDPSSIVDLSAKAERERLSPGAIKAFLNMWKVAREGRTGDLDQSRLMRNATLTTVMQRFAGASARNHRAFLRPPTSHRGK